MESRDKNHDLNKSDLNSAANLLNFIEEEVGDISTEKGLKNVFQPITDGLGFHPPKHLVHAMNIQVEKEREQNEKAAPKIEAEKATGFSKSPSKTMESQNSKPKMEEVMPEPIKPLLSKEKPISTVLPPPLPYPTMMRRSGAAVVDYFFVFTLWLFALVITLKFFTGSVLGGQVAGIPSIQDPQFVRFAILEFGALWFCYFAICLGILEMTFGMWICGIRVRSDAETQLQQIFRKGLRVFWSALFYAFMAPMILLCFAGKKGRNLLDVISGTSVYKVAA